MKNIWNIGGFSNRGRFQRIFKFLLDFLGSRFLSRKTKKGLKKVSNVCFFMGYPRSGHSLVASILDAHPNTLISNEADMFGLLEAGFKKNTIFEILASNSKRNSNGGRFAGSYSYKINNQSQGSFDELKIIGDKQGGLTSYRIQKNPKLFELFKSNVSPKIKVIYVTRNPFDIIATMAMRIYSEGYDKVTDSDLKQSLDWFDSMNTANINFFRNNRDIDFIHIPHEKFVKNPRDEITNLLDFLDLPIDQEFIRNCSLIINQKLHEPRQKVNWSNELKANINKIIRENPCLENYYHD